MKYQTQALTADEIARLPEEIRVEVVALKADTLDFDPDLAEIFADNDALIFKAAKAALTPAPAPEASPEPKAPAPAKAKPKSAPKEDPKRKPVSPLFAKLVPLHQQQALNGMARGGGEDSRMEIAAIKASVSEMLEAIPTKPDNERPAFQKMVAARYFFGDSDWYVLDRSGEDQYFGYVILNGDTQMSELGYIDIAELVNHNRIELDFYWTPKPLGEVLHKRWPDDFDKPEPKAAPKPDTDGPTPIHTKGETLVYPYKDGKLALVNAKAYGSGLNAAGAKYNPNLKIGDHKKGAYIIDATLDQVKAILNASKEKPAPVRMPKADTDGATYKERIMPILEALHDEDENMPKQRVLEYAIRIQEARKASSVATDNAKEARMVLEPTYLNLLRWAMSPGRYDMQGIDIAASRPATVEARVDKAKFFSRLRIHR